LDEHDRLATHGHETLLPCDGRAGRSEGDRLRQEEIAEEIEVILLTAGAADTELGLV
jgi:hypothetical protein